MSRIYVEPNVKCTLYLGFILCVAKLAWALCTLGRRPTGYPPGPPTLPIIGNLHQIPSKQRHVQFEKWAREYGPVYSLILGTKTMIVLNTDEAIKELLDRRGAIYSSRPDAYVAQDIISGGMRILFMPNSGLWTVARKLARRILSINAARTYVPYQDLESTAMIVELLEKPANFISHIRRYTASLTTQMTFGFRTTTMRDERFKEAFDIFDRSSEVSGSKAAILLDLLPILRWLPDIVLPVKKAARLLHRRELRLFHGLYLDAKRRLETGTMKPCVCVDLIKMQSEHGFKDELSAYLSGSLLQAGFETTASILVGFVQAMVIFPDVAKKAQRELDAVCGDRVPDLNNVPNLPYIRACAKESMRWMPGFMLGVPHRVTKNDTYMNYLIPKDATVIMNVWAVHNDPDRHYDPRRFDPMRYFDDHQTSIDAANNPDPSKRDHFVFGAGRRRCQGMHLADRSLFLGISRLLWAFDFHKAVDAQSGKEITPDMNDLMDGVMALPNPFPVNIKSRSAVKERNIRAQWAEMSDMLDEEKQWKRVPEGLIWRDEDLAESRGQVLFSDIS